MTAKVLYTFMNDVYNLAGWDLVLQIAGVMVHILTPHKILF